MVRLVMLRNILQAPELLDPIVRMRNLILHTRSSDSPGGMLVAFLALLVTAADLPAGSAKGGPDGLARSRA